MTTNGGGGVMLELTAARRAPLARLVTAWFRQRHSPDPEAPASAPEDLDLRVEVREVEVLRTGRPGLLDVLAEVDGRPAHAVLGVRPSAADQPLPLIDDDGLGLIQDDEGLAVVIDAIHDVDMAPLVLETVTGESGGREGTVIVNDDEEGTVLEFESCTFTVFPWVAEGPHRGVELLMALDEAGFNHLAAPIAVWRRGGRDLGVVQERLSGSAGGWALALTSLRDLYGSGGAPEEAGGDFGPEAQALGTMTARMHLALDRAFGHETAKVSDWVDAVEEGVRGSSPDLLQSPEARDAMAGARASGAQAAIMRTHGDFHLGRTARTDVGWVVADCLPGGRPPGAEAPVFRSPLADVADLLWSLHHVSTVAATERDPTGRGDLTPLARAWAARNRLAFLSAYLAAPGIDRLVPRDRSLVRELVSVFELERAAAVGAGR